MLSQLFVFIADSAHMLNVSLASSRYLARDPYLTHAQLLDKQLTDVALCVLMYHSPFLVSVYW